MHDLWLWDHAVFRTIHLGWHQSWLDPIFWVISTTGLGYVQVLLALLLLPWKAMLTRTGARQAALEGRFNLPGLIVLAYAISGIANGIFKHEFPRDRPSNLVWAHPQETFYANSFSSGHTATAFAIAVTIFLYTRAKGQSLPGVIALTWACLVGISRIYRGVHWPTDVVAGALVGAACGCMVALIGSKTFVPPPAADDQADTVSALE